MRDAVTTIALALPSSRPAMLVRKCSTMICTFWEMLCGCSRTHRITDLTALDLSRVSSLLRHPSWATLNATLYGV